jgi:hypothetical protein
MGMIRDRWPKCPHCGARLSPLQIDSTNVFPCPNCCRELELSQTAMRISGMLILLFALLLPWLFGFRGWSLAIACLVAYGLGFGLSSAYFFLLPPPVLLSRSKKMLDNSELITVDIAAKNDEVKENPHQTKAD